LVFLAFPINRFSAVYLLASDYTFAGKKCVWVGKSPSRPIGWAFDSLMKSQVPLSGKEEMRKGAKDHLLQGLK
jgi:hypothetical protein